MVKTIRLSSKSDLIGAVASAFCFLHCLATPLLFVAYAGSSIAAESHPWWWGTLDIFFLAISFIAVYWSASSTSRNWIKYLLWFCWGFLSLVILNEKFEIGHLPEEIIYLPTIGLMLLHYYNHHLCRRENNDCGLDK